MKTVLDGAHTWFLESFRQGPYDKLVIRLAEGAMSATAQPWVNPAGDEQGQAHRVATSAPCRVAEVIFDNALAFFTFREGFDASDPNMVLEEHASYIRRVEQSSLQEFARQATGLYTTWIEGITEYHVWTEEQIFQVFSVEPPRVCILADAPDTTIARGETWVRAGGG